MNNFPHERPFVLGTPLDGIAFRRSQTFDLYLPQSQSPQPAVVFVHGPVPAELLKRPEFSGGSRTRLRPGGRRCSGYDYPEEVPR